MITEQANGIRGTVEGTVQAFEIDPAHTMAEFAVKHMMISTVKGRFVKVAGTIYRDQANPLNSGLEATAEVASVETADEQRNAHLRSADFFDADNFPTITLKSKRLEERGHGEYRVVADLTIRGVTREAVFDVSYLGEGNDPWGNTRIGLSASAQINRKDFGLQWNVALEAGGFLVGDLVKINLEVEAVKKS